MLDTKITNGFVVDGTGRPGAQLEIGIVDGRIAEIAPSVGSARHVIDAGGHVVSPGFIDVHTHLDVQGFWDPMLTPSPLHGVTTVVGGNCGFSVAPLDDANAEFLMRMLARVEGMPLETLEQAVPWNWSTTEQFLDRLDGTLAVNAGFMVGHSALRRRVMGTAGSERPATDDEIRQMQSLLADGLAAGGFGFSSSWSPSHFDGDGAPVPSRFASRDELVALSGVCRRHPGTSLEFVPAAGIGPFTDDDVDVMVAMSLAAGRPLNWNLLSVTTDSFDLSIDKLRAGRIAAERGAKIVGLVLARNPGSRYSFMSGVGLDGLPGWAATMAMPTDEKLAALRSPESRAELRALAAQPSSMSHHADWATKFIVEVVDPSLQRYAGRYVGEIAAAEGSDPFDCLLDICCQDELRTSFLNNPRPDTAADWARRVEVFRDPGAVIGASDAGAHLDMVATFDFPSVVLGEAVRTQQVLSIEGAVHLLTQAPADLYGLVGRGTLARGNAADIVVFDPATVGTETAVTVGDLPGGARRLYARGFGYHSVLVNGVAIVDDGVVTGSTPGTLMRSGTSSLHTELEVLAP